MKRLLYFLALLLILSGCKTKTQENTAPVVIMREAIHMDNHYQLYTDGESVFLKDVKEDSTITLRKCYETIKERLTLPTISSKAPPPESDITAYLEEVTPFTYDATLETSTMYLQHLKESGWVIFAQYANYLYLDMYLKKADTYMRVIVLDEKIKIFKNISGEAPDPLSYVSEGASKKK